MEQTKEEAFAIFNKFYYKFDAFEGPIVRCNIGKFNKRLLKMSYDKDFVQKADNEISKEIDCWRSPYTAKIQIEKEISVLFPEIQKQNVAAICDVYYNYVEEYFSHMGKIRQIAHSNDGDTYCGYFNTKAEKIIDVIVIRPNQISRVPFYNNAHSRAHNKRNLE